MPSKAALKQEALWRRYKRNPLAFFRECWQIQHPQGRRLFEPREPQIIATQEWMGGANYLTLKARQIGWSTLVAAFTFWKAFFHEDKRCLLISRGERESQELLAKIKFGWDNLPRWLRSRGPDLLNDNLQSMKFNNGSEITSLPSANNPARGFSGSLVVVDEWAFLLNAEEAWAAIEPVSDIGGQVIGLSTANGSGNWFHSMWERTEAGLTSFKPMFFSWRAVPERDDAWYEQKKLDMEPWQLAQEYPNTPEEAFIKSGNPVFGDWLDGIGDMLRQPALGELWDATAGGVGAYEFREIGGNLKVWERPVVGDAYVIGADVAEGLEWGDFSSAHVIHLRSGEVVAHWHGHIAADEYADVLDAMGRFYNMALIGPEANNHGLTTITHLRRNGYPNIYRRRQLNTAGKQMGYQFGWQTTKTSKPLLVDELGKALREGEIVLRDERTLKELRTFVRDERGRMHGSPFDDCVISLGLANQMRKYAYQVEHAPSVNDYMTVDWWMRQAAAQRTHQAGADWVIGSRNGRQSGRSRLVSR